MIKQSATHPQPFIPQPKHMFMYHHRMFPGIYAHKQRHSFVAVVLQSQPCFVTPKLCVCFFGLHGLEAVPEVHVVGKEGCVVWVWVGSGDCGETFGR